MNDQFPLRYQPIYQCEFYPLLLFSLALDVCKSLVFVTFQLTRKTIIRLWGDYKRSFGGLNSFRDTPEVDFEKGIHWIDAWVPQDLKLLEVSDKRLKEGEE